jgi:hypothetical protein
MSSWGKIDQANNAPYWAVNAAIAKAAPSEVNAAPTATNVAYLYGNTAPSAYITNETVGLFLVDATEKFAGSDNITDVSIINGGTLYVEAPTVTFSGGGGASAAATATISGGAVTKIVVTNVGSSYETVPTVTIPKARVTIPTTGITTGTDTIAYTTHGLTANSQVVYQNGGGASATGLTSGNTYYVIASGLTANAFKVSETLAGASVDISGTGNDAQYFEKVASTATTALAIKGLGQSGGSDSGFTHAPHVGWNIKRVGTGGRAGRVQYETLVALANPTGDGSDDIALPDA